MNEENDTTDKLKVMCGGKKSPKKKLCEAGPDKKRDWKEILGDPKEKGCELFFDYLKGVGCTKKCYGQCAGKQ